MAFYPPAWCHSFGRPLAEPFFHPGPHDGAAVARSGGQRRPYLGAARRALAAGGDTQDPAHGGDREFGLIFAHEPEPFDGIVFVSRANQAAAFERISLSSLSWRFSRLSWLSSSRSAVVRPSPRRPASHSACPTQFLIDCAVGSNSCASSSGERPARTSSTIWRRNSGV